MYSLDVIILSNTIDDNIYQMNLNCINSLFSSEKDNGLKMKAIIVESNKKSLYIYPENVTVIKPDEKFNYNKFMNIGIQSSKADFVALCNNDLIFFKNWFTEILKYYEKNPDILSFSPYDDTNVHTSPLEYEEPNVYLGYGVRKEIAGWCIIVKRKIFDIIKYFDETFDFYYVDDDYGMTLRKYALKNALITTSKVQHLGGQVTTAVKEESGSIFSDIKVEGHAQNISGGNSWLLNNPKALEGHNKFHKKWGSMRMIAIKNRLIKHFPFLNKPLITRILY